MSEKAKSIVRGEKKIGRVYYLKASRGLFPLSVLRKAERRSSKQLKEEARFLSEKGLKPLPFDVNGLLALQENCSYFDSCVRQIAKDVVGQGWTLVESSEEANEKEVEEQKKKAREFLEDPNEEQEEAIEDIIEKCIIDWGVVGWFAIEVSRDPASKEVNGLWHIPAHTIRVHKSKELFCQVRNNKYRWFKQIGLEKNFDADTGNEVSAKAHNLANEIIFFKNYYPRSSYYGAPNILGAVGAARGLISVRDYNLSFFDNYGVPAALVTLEGDWEENSMKYINDFLDVEIKGSSNAHKTLVLELPSGGSLTWKPLSIEVKEGSFNLYYKQSRDEVLSSYKMPPYRIGISETGSLGGSTAKESTAIYINSTIAPLQKAVNRILTKSIVHNGLNCEHINFQFNKIDTRDLDSEVKRWQTLFSLGAINANYIRDKLNLEKVDHGDDYYIAATYLPISEESITRREASIEELNMRVNEIIEEYKKSKKGE
ncbi:MAG: phage portal protein [Candidatus Freyarchaeota archaeon]